MPYFLRGAFRGFETALTRYLKTVGLPISHFHILRQQWDDVGHSQAFLAEKSFMSESVASQVLQQMIADGLLKRKVHPKDKRARLITLTKKGLKLREKVVVEGMAVSRTHAPDISPEDVKTTIAVLKEIRRAFDDYNAAYFENK